MQAAEPIEDNLNNHGSLTEKPAIAKADQRAVGIYTHMHC